MASEFTSFICLEGRVQQNFRGCYGMVYLMRRIAIPVLFPFTSMSRIPFSSAGAGLGPWHFQRMVWIKRDKNLTQSPIIKQAVKIYDEVGNQHKETGMETSIKTNTLKNVGFLHVVRFFCILHHPYFLQGSILQKKLKHFLSSHFTQSLASTPVFSGRTW